VLKKRDSQVLFFDQGKNTYSNSITGACGKCSRHLHGNEGRNKRRGRKKGMCELDDLTKCGKCGFDLPKSKFKFEGNKYLANKWCRDCIQNNGNTQGKVNKTKEERAKAYLQRIQYALEREAASGGQLKKCSVCHSIKSSGFFLSHIILELVAVDEVEIWGHCSTCFAYLSYRRDLKIKALDGRGCSTPGCDITLPILLQFHHPEHKNKNVSHIKVKEEYFKEVELTEILYVTNTLIFFSPHLVALYAIQKKQWNPIKIETSPL